MIKLSSKKIAEVVGSISQVIDEDVENVSTDSRTIFDKDLFIAIKGEKFDGHNFLKEVMDKGASMVMVEKLSPDVPATRQILVENTTIAYGKLGAYIRLLYKGKVIGLTGSSGKTTLKEEIRFILQKFAPTFATEGNFNNHIGVPKNLCDLDMNSDFAVIEMGMSAKGELSNLTSYVKPDIAIVNNVYPMHIEFFADGLEGIAKAKAEIFEGLSSKGVAIFNQDTNFANILEEQAKKHTKQVISFGKDNIISVFEDDDGSRVKARIGDKELSYKLSMKGIHHVYNSLCVLMVVDALGLDVRKTAGHLKDFEELAGRGKRYKLKLKKGSYTLIDDSYSGQPDAMKIAIETLASYQGGRKIAVLGKMAELGAMSKEKHIEIGKVLANNNIDVVIGVCPETKDMLAQLPSEAKQYYFENKDGLDEFLLNNILQNNDIVLIKGAHYSSRLFEVASVLIKQGK